MCVFVVRVNRTSAPHFLNHIQIFKRIGTQIFDLLLRVYQPFSLNNVWLLRFTFHTKDEVLVTMHYCADSFNVVERSSDGHLTYRKILKVTGRCGYLDVGWTPTSQSIIEDSLDTLFTSLLFIVSILTMAGPKVRREWPRAQM